MKNEYRMVYHSGRQQEAFKVVWFELRNGGSTSKVQIGNLSNDRRENKEFDPSEPTSEVGAATPPQM